MRWLQPFSLFILLVVSLVQAEVTEPCEGEQCSNKSDQLKLDNGEDHLQDADERSTDQKLDEQVKKWNAAWERREKRAVRSSAVISGQCLDSETSFGLRLLQHSASNKSLVVSPLSILLALSLVHEGANGNSKEQIRNVMCGGGSDDDLREHYQQLAYSISDDHYGVQFDVANKAFVHETLNIKEEYLSTIEVNYNASAETVNFLNADASAKTINDFVSEATKGNIDSIIKPKDIASDTKLYLVNALYMKADWSEYITDMTVKSRQFQPAEGVNKEIPFISKYGEDLKYMENDEVKVLSLDYADTAYTFNVFIPKERFGLANFISNLTAPKLQGLLSNLTLTYVSFYLPVIEKEKEMSLKPVLQSMGITDIFSEKDADFSGISDTTKLVVADGTHKVVIKVDEKGTEAAAVTGFRFYALSCNFRDPLEVWADQPFLYVITYGQHPVFMGTFY